MNQLRKRIGIIWLCLSVAFAIMPYNPVYAEEAREESLAEATQEEKNNEETKEEKIRISRKTMRILEMLMRILIRI